MSGQPPPLARFDVFPFVLAPPGGVLADLRARGLRLGLISNTGQEISAVMNAVLAPTGLFAQLNPDLSVYSADERVTQESPEIFRRAAARAGEAEEACMFVGEDKVERAVALSAGFKNSPGHGSSCPSARPVACGAAAPRLRADALRGVAGRGSV